MPSDKDLQKVKQLLDVAEINLRQAKNILFVAELSGKAKNLSTTESDVVEGVFSGDAMVDGDNKSYPVPANYASKSKLVAGDILKLTILADGTFLFKQIGPVKRKKLVGELVEISDNEFVVKSGESEYRVLPASITYFKAKAGDKITILAPESEISEWAAVENIIES